MRHTEHRLKQFKTLQQEMNPDVPSHLNPHEPHVTVVLRFYLNPI